MQFVKRCRGRSSAVADVFKRQSRNEYVDFDFEILLVNASRVVVAQFQQFCTGNVAQFLCTEQRLVVAAKKFVIVVVFPEVAEQRIDKFVDVTEIKQGGIVEKTFKEFVFLVLCHAENVVVVAVKCAAAQPCPCNKFGYGNFGEFAFFRK